jgi:hypothetical protein
LLSEHTRIKNPNEGWPSKQSFFHNYRWIFLKFIYWPSISRTLLGFSSWISHEWWLSFIHTWFYVLRYFIFDQLSHPFQLSNLFLVTQNYYFQELCITYHTDVSQNVLWLVKVSFFKKRYQGVFEQYQNHSCVVPLPVATWCKFIQSKHSDVFVYKSLPVLTSRLWDGPLSEDIEVMVKVGTWNWWHRMWETLCSVCWILYTVFRRKYYWCVSVLLSPALRAAGEQTTLLNLPEARNQQKSTWTLTNSS